MTKVKLRFQSEGEKRRKNKDSKLYRCAFLLVFCGQYNPISVQKGQGRGWDS